MADWVLIPCLKALFAEFDKIAPSRDHASDGSVGDTAHQEESSDHNPDETGNVPIHDADHVNEVHAIDVDNTLNRSDLTMEKVVQFLLGRCRSGAERRLRYMIYNRRIWSASSGWVQKTYTGSSPHTEHAHFSGSYETALEASTASWALVEEFGDDMSVQEVVDGNTQYDAKTKQGDSPEGTTWWGNNTGRAVWDNQYMPNPISGGKTSGYALLRDLATQIMLVKQGLADLAGKDFTDEAAIVQGVLAGLAESESIQEIADIFIAALPADLAKQVVDEMAKRLAPPESDAPDRP
jgi:hypothetical protein